MCPNALASHRVEASLRVNGQLHSALHEATELGERAARYVTDNVADYQIPMNADIQTIDAIIVLNAAVANAVYHATAKRVRELPIRLEKLI
jgi:xanthine dehydrogenase YagR molybdenum-binding subunit